MNVCSRIETTGKPNKIHISQETANCLKEAGKEHWFTLREDKVVAKGKGELTTFWLGVKGDNSKSTHSGSSEGRDPACDLKEGCGKNTSIFESPVTFGENGDHAVSQEIRIDQKEQREKSTRLVQWMVVIFTRTLREIVARRDAQDTKTADATRDLRACERDMNMLTTMTGVTCMVDEVSDIISLPTFDAVAAGKQKDPKDVVLGDLVMKQLYAYVTILAEKYQPNPFHNFEHACHVTMSVVKLLTRIVAPEVNENHSLNELVKDIHDHTYGITSSPLTRFAVVLSAVIHDLDHPGVPNATLVSEATPLAKKYKEKSVAEQNSVQLAWDILMQEEFQELRDTIYATTEEFKLFRKLVVNSVMATDIVDKDLGVSRKNRWAKAFSADTEESVVDAVNRKATIVIEHLIQASDVAHTMQHWHIYRKWNMRFFEECYKGYLSGRAGTDPSEGWYRGELGFFDFYIIPLAKKLKNCGVFGVSSDEYLNYAEQNRREWEVKGETIVTQMVNDLKIKYKVPSSLTHTSIIVPG